jgi:hypothetical protein
MNATPRNVGVGVHWGVNSTGITGYGTLVLNSAGINFEADTVTAADAYGYVVSEVSYNHRESANLEVWISGSSAATNASVPSGSVPQPGDTVTLTDSVATAYAGTNWIAGNASINRVNNSYATATVPLHRYAKI